MNWYKLPVIGECPPEMMKHTLTQVGGKFYLLGLPSDPSLHPKGDDENAFIHVFDPETLRWSRRRTGGMIPGHRVSHTATSLQDKIFLFGGGSGSKYYDDVSVLEVKTLTWTKQRINPKSNVTLGGRRAHTATSFGKNFFLFGGADDSGKACCDLWTFDSERNEFNSIPLEKANSGVQLSGRGHHTCSNILDKILIYGGSDTKECFSDLFLIDIEKKSISSLKAVNGFPRYSHTATLVGNSLFVFGGCDGIEYMNDINVLNLESMEWKTITVSGTPPSPRGFHTTLLYDNRLWVFGGMNEEKTFSDMHVLDLGTYSFLTRKKPPKI